MLASAECIENSLKEAALLEKERGRGGRRFMYPLRSWSGAARYRERVAWGTARREWEWRGRSKLVCSMGTVDSILVGARVDERADLN